jgi:hypothetical protein
LLFYPLKIAWKQQICALKSESESDVFMKRD